MGASEEAAEQLVRMTLSGSEVALKLTGTGAKNIAAVLMAAASSKEQTKGKTRLETMLKSGKELKVFQIANKDLKDFATEAKKYGVLYVVVQKPHGKDKSGELVDLMVKAEDASKINRIIDKLDMAKVDAAEVVQVVGDIECSHVDTSPATKDAGVQDKGEAMRLLDALQTKPTRADSKQADNPLVEKPESAIPSDPTSATKSPSEKATTKRTSDERDKRKSIRTAIDDIKQERREISDADRSKAPAKTINHTHPTNNSIKAKTTKGR